MNAIYGFNSDKTKAEIRLTEDDFVRISAAGWAPDPNIPRLLIKVGRICYANFGARRSSVQVLDAGSKIIIGRVPDGYIPFKNFQFSTQYIKHGSSSASDLVDAVIGIDELGQVFIKNRSQEKCDVDSCSVRDFFYVSTN